MIYIYIWQFWAWNAFLCSSVLVAADDDNEDEESDDNEEEKDDENDEEEEEDDKEEEEEDTKHKNASWTIRTTALARPGTTWTEKAGREAAEGTGADRLKGRSQHSPILWGGYD